MKYLVNMLYDVMQHTVGVWETVHITKYDHIYVTRATHFKNTCKKPGKTSFWEQFWHDSCSDYYVIKTGPRPDIGMTWTGPISPVQCG
jgi:hypothetical protein